MSSTLSHFKREHGVSLETLLWKRASSHVEGRISGLFMGCGGKRGVPLEFQWVSQVPAPVASKKSGLFSSCQGPVGTPLGSLLVNRAVSRVPSGNSVFLSGGDRDLGLPIKVQLGNQASSGVEACNSAFLSSCQRGVRPSVEFRWGIWVFQANRQGRQASHPVVRGYSMFHWRQCRCIRTYLEQKGNSTFFFLAAGSAGFHSRFNW